MQMALVAYADKNFMLNLVKTKHWNHVLPMLGCGNFKPPPNLL